MENEDNYQEISFNQYENDEVDTSPILILSEKTDIPHGEYIGYCKWFNNKLGYGFIRVGSGDLTGKDIFVHHSGLNPLNSNFKTLFKGEYMHFNVIDGKNGKQAVDVTGIYGGPLMCDNMSTTSLPSRESVRGRNSSRGRGGRPYKTSNNQDDF